MHLSKFFVVAIVIAFLAIAANPASANAQLKHGAVVYDMQILQTYYKRVRVTFYGSNFSTLWTQFVLSNTSRCGNGALNAVQDKLTLPVTFGNYDKKGMFSATFDAVNESAVTYACVS